jgi:hypothetical protein
MCVPDGRTNTTKMATSNIAGSEAAQLAVPSYRPCHVLLVGSIPLPSTEDVFQELTTTLPNRLLRIPDGETGIRSQYVMWQLDLLKDYRGADNTHEAPPFTHLKFVHTGFQDYAVDSYREFCRLRDKDVVPKGVRFQVCLPTPLNVIAPGVHAKYQVKVEPMYEAALLSDLQYIQSKIPAEDLAIQWDAALEFAFLEMSEKGDLPYPETGLVLKPWFTPIKEGIIQRMVRLAESVDKDVQMGFHLCYGDLAHKHFVEPQDMSNLVEIANIIVDIIKRKVNWIHMPVPKSRVDQEYYASLRRLKLQEGTEIYLGLEEFRSVMEIMAAITKPSPV